MHDYFHITEQNSINLRELLNAYQKATDEHILCSITDLQGTIIYANKIFCETSQYEVYELVGKSHNIVNASYHANDFFKEMWDTISAGNIWRGEVKNRAKDGSDYWLDSVIIPIKDLDGNIQQYLSLRILINDKKKAEEEKNQHIKDLEELLFILSHEVRKPVANLLGIANMFEKYIDEPIELRKLIDHIKNNADILDHFTKKLTTFIHELGLNEKKNP
jgi:PAS domain S-box-containing protein